jgi:N6-L-threonylcarbamoyladenine synthase
MYVLGIDTSCDDTSVALYDERESRIVAEAVSSRMELHSKYGGVVPEIAARQHLELLLPMIQDILDEAGLISQNKKPDLISVTRGPGLIGGLLVGFSCAKALSMGWGVPFVGVNHIEGHLISASLTNENITYPHIALVVSGGHSELYLAKSPSEYSLLGETRDDAAGELLDKVGRLLDIPFPAGNTIDNWAMDADSTVVPKPAKSDKKPLKFPRPLLDSDNLEFSFSGLKTACLYFLQSEKAKTVTREEVGAELLRAVVDCLLGKAFLACRMNSCQTLVISGGVSSSRYLRKEAHARSLRKNVKVIFPLPGHCTDNAAMIALAGLYRYRTRGGDAYDLDCEASLAVGEG